MPNAAWPPSLPAYVLEQGFSESFEEVTIETAMDAGPVKIRRRFTTNARKFTVTVQFSPAEMATFSTFWRTTLQGGSLPFDWVDPRTRAAATFRFRKPAPQVTVVGGLYSRVTMNLELMP